MLYELLVYTYICMHVQYVCNSMYEYLLLVPIALPVVQVVKQPSSVIKANDSLNITCTASGVGLISVTWSKESDGAQLTGNNDHSVTIGKLHVLFAIYYASLYNYVYYSISE